MRNGEDRLTTRFWPYLSQFLSVLHDLGLVLKLAGTRFLTRTRTRDPHGLPQPLPLPRQLMQERYPSCCRSHPMQAQILLTASTSWVVTTNYFGVLSLMSHNFHGKAIQLGLGRILRLDSQRQKIRKQARQLNSMQLSQLNFTIWWLCQLNLIQVKISSRRYVPVYWTQLLVLLTIECSFVMLWAKVVRHHSVYCRVMHPSFLRSTTPPQAVLMPSTLNAIVFQASSNFLANLLILWPKKWSICGFLPSFAKTMMYLHQLSDSWIRFYFG